jgi:hypothetical protein
LVAWLVGFLLGCLVDWMIGWWWRWRRQQWWLMIDDWGSVISDDSWRYYDDEDVQAKQKEQEPVFHFMFAPMLRFSFPCLAPLTDLISSKTNAVAVFCGRALCLPQACWPVLSHRRKPSGLDLLLCGQHPFFTDLI